jgi:hypothetical protein
MTRVELPRRRRALFKNARLADAKRICAKL